LQDVFNRNDENVFHAAAGLHGGIGGKRDVCGSLLGAAMMLGLTFGGGTGETSASGDKENPTRMVGQLYQWFKNEFGTVKCRTINAGFEKEVNDDINNSGLPEPARKARVFARCDDLCGKTAARTAEMIWDALHKEK
jgi:C_GCAxxG_C_C family probable redox protein